MSDIRFKKLGLQIEKQSKKNTQIKKVTAGSSNNRITIKVLKSNGDYMAIIWNVENDLEIESFDTSETMRTFYSSAGNTFIINDQSVIVSEQGVKLKSYTVDE